MSMNQMLICADCPSRCNLGEFCVNAETLLNEEMKNMLEMVDECESLADHSTFIASLEKLIRCKSDLDFLVDQLEYTCPLSGDSAVNA